MRNTPTMLLLGLTALSASAGCESKTSVTGTVTFDGTKLAKGYITFYPATDQGETQGAKATTHGAEIVEGAYTVADIAPGKRKVVVSVPPKLVAQKSTDPAKPSVQALPPDNPIPANAPGNSKLVDVVAGSQTLNFTLQKK